MKTLFRDQNLGCAKAVSGGISWFFENESEGIILEDDVLVHLTWFRFVDEMLEKYRDEHKIICVTAHGYGNSCSKKPSYTFSKYNHCWGWASWRRAWASYDYSMLEWPTLRNSSWLKKVGGSRAFSDYWMNCFDSVHNGTVDTWDYQWTYSAWISDSLSVHPGRNMVENIGFGPDATHTKSKCDLKWNIQPMSFPLRHPSEIKINYKYDRIIDHRHFGISPLRRFLASIRVIKFLKKIKNFFK